LFTSQLEAWHCLPRTYLVNTIQIYSKFSIILFSYNTFDSRIKIICMCLPWSHIMVPYLIAWLIRPVIAKRSCAQVKVLQNLDFSFLSSSVEYPTINSSLFLTGSKNRAQSLLRATTTSRWGLNKSIYLITSRDVWCMDRMEALANWHASVGVRYHIIINKYRVNNGSFWPILTW